jgi:hypothetical protein
VEYWAAFARADRRAKGEQTEEDLEEEKRSSTKRRRRVKLGKTRAVPQTPP